MTDSEFEKPVILQEARKQYLLRRLKEIVSCRSALIKGDWTTILRTAENLEGNAETFGFSSLSRLGIALQITVGKKNTKKAHALLFQFEKVVLAELSKL